MAVNKVVRSDGTTLIDLTGDTVTDAGHIMSGYVGHLANGTQVTGTGQGGGALWKSVTLEEDYIAASNGCIPQWVERLGVDELTDLNNHIYIYDFTGNTVGNLYGNMLIVRQESGSNRRIINIRASYSSVSTSEASNRAFYATAGTVINIYRL